MNLKDSIRNQIKNKRNNMSAELVQKLSLKVINNLKSVNAVFKNNKFLVYNSFKNEVETNELIKHLESLNKVIAYPIIRNGELLAGKVVGSEFIDGEYGIREPKSYDIVNNIEVVIVPLVACDENKNRIGFGKGYYDKYLQNKSLLKVGLSYDFQVVKTIQSSKFDIPLDIIITESRVIK